MIILTCIQRNLFGILLCILALTLSGCTQQEEKTQLQQIVERKALRVGTVFGATSYYIDREGSTGFEYELAKTFADYLGVELEIIPNYQVGQLFPMLDNKTVDFLAGGLTITEQRRKKYRYSPGYYEISQKLVFKQGNKRPKNFAQLDGDLVVTAQSSHAETLTGLQSQQPDLVWRESEHFDPDELLTQIVDDKIAYTVADSTNLAINRRLYPNLSVGFTVTHGQQVGWMFKQQHDNSLYAVMIEFFGHINQTGQLKQLYDKYFGHVQKFNYVDTKLFIKATATKLPKYEAMFKQYALDLDWRLLAALSYQESLWNPRAKSPTGVRGIMMLTLPTAKQMGVTSRLDAEQNIRGGGKYLNRLLKRVPERIQMPDRLWFAIASYNIGWGHVEDARIITQRQGANPDKWIDVRERLPLLRKRKYYKKTRYGYARGDEPVKYVDNIRRYYHSLVWLDEKRQQDIRTDKHLQQQNESTELKTDETDQQSDELDPLKTLTEQKSSDTTSKNP